MPNPPPNNNDEEERERISHDDMMRAVEIFKLIADTRRRPPRSRFQIALAMTLYAADVARDDPVSSTLLRKRMLQVADDLRVQEDVK